jgi:hypothetical protein
MEDERRARGCNKNDGTQRPKPSQPLQLSQQLARHGLLPGDYVTQAPPVIPSAPLLPTAPSVPAGLTAKDTRSSIDIDINDAHVNNQSPGHC